MTTIGNISVTRRSQRIANTQTFTSNGTWTNPYPTTRRRIRIRGWAGGAPGGGGRQGAAGTVRCGGGPGGAGAYFDRESWTDEQPTTILILLGAGGAAVAGQTNADSNGLTGSAGGLTAFGEHIRAYGGQPGSGGTAAAGNAGFSGASMFAPPTGSSASSTGLVGNQSAGSYGGAGAPGSPGGGITTANAASNGGGGGNTPRSQALGLTTVGGQVGGANPTGGCDGVVPFSGGTGGGGGASSAAGPGQDGQKGKFPGGGGGGGGASVNGQTAGGSLGSGDGYLHIEVYA